MASTRLEVVGTVTGMVTLNPIILGAVAGPESSYMPIAYVVASNLAQRAAIV